MNKRKILELLVGILFLAGLVGEVKCILKATRCNWSPVGKAEVFYTAASFVPPVGAIVGYLNIEDK
tara:strand:+ start:214 stop:411 length:198 start_codon:yes stop_codon:yes gene_type:complete